MNGELEFLSEFVDVRNQIIKNSSSLCLLGESIFLFQILLFDLMVVILIFGHIIENSLEMLLFQLENRRYKAGFTILVNFLLRYRKVPRIYFVFSLNPDKFHQIGQ